MTNMRRYLDLLNENADDPEQVKIISEVEPTINEDVRIDAIWPQFKVDQECKFIDPYVPAIRAASSHIKLVGTMGDYDVATFRDNAWYVIDGKACVLTMQLDDPEFASGPMGGARSVRNVGVRSPHRGEGIALKFYQWIVGRGIVLASGQHQTSLGNTLWKRLSATGTVRITRCWLDGGEWRSEDVADFAEVMASLDASEVAQSYFKMEQA